MLQYFIFFMLSFCEISVQQITAPVTASSLNLPFLAMKQEPNGFNIVDILPKNYVKDATVDYTNLIQKAINTHDVLVFPDFPLLINQSGLKIPSHKDVYFKKGSILKFIDSSDKSYRVLLLRNSNDVRLYDPVITVLATSGTASNNPIGGMGIAIYSGKNITIRNPVVKNCSGDGIYIGENSLSQTPENIIISNPLCDANKRNGLTIVSGNNVSINGGVLSNSAGKMPMAGLDIEPNSSTNQLKNININNVQTINNKGKGLQIGLSKFLKDSCKLMQVNIFNHRDSGSASALIVSSSKTDCGDLTKSMINIINPVWKDNRIQVVKIFNSYKISPLISIKNPTIIQRNIQLEKTDVEKRLLENSSKPVNITFDQ